ncbi:hypothetical protein OIU34_20040 [Pararhizobium sp. BT-229]|uniref:hypothetical protein n=1 Tax=Pararhizobium sp. BT-229 TaxID=2986923 RepID=UPI0021F701D0|nr:hypothetical protein [Pararhizobium sp. BT-229]MCV9964178.1 hypothetical protein [Pararhizobium sp. BT-229]
MMDRRSKIPHLLNVLRGTLGDAGIPHSLKRTKNGWPYIRFDAPSLGIEVSVQFRAKRRHPETKAVQPAHFLAFLPGDSPGRQATRSFETMSEILPFLGIDEQAVTEGKKARMALSTEERAKSVMTREVERSYVSMMKL